MEELEKICQEKVEELLNLRRELLEYQDEEEDQELEKTSSLPHYITILEMFRSIEQQELFLLEINDQIQTITREEEMEEIKKAMRSLRMLDQPSDSRLSFIRDWLDQMMKYDEENEDQAEATRLFYDIVFDDSAKTDGESMEELSFGTRYKGRCTRVSVRAPAMCRNPDPSCFDFSASLYVDGLVTKGQEFIAKGRSPQEYVEEVLWAGLQDLIDIS